MRSRSVESRERHRLPPYWTAPRTNRRRTTWDGWVITGAALLLWTLWVIYTEFRFSAHEWRALLVLAATGVLWEEAGWADSRMWFRVRIARPESAGGAGPMVGLMALSHRWRPEALRRWWRDQGLLPVLTLAGTLALSVTA